jgi:hypothetical protein
MIGSDLSANDWRKINFDELIIESLEQANHFLENKGIGMDYNCEKLIFFKKNQLIQKKHMFTINKALYECYFLAKTSSFDKKNIIKVRII